MKGTGPGRGLVPRVGLTPKTSERSLGTEDRAKHGTQGCANDPTHRVARRGKHTTNSKTPTGRTRERLLAYSAMTPGSPQLCRQWRFAKPAGVAGRWIVNRPWTTVATKFKQSKTIMIDMQYSSHLFLPISQQARLGHR